MKFSNLPLSKEMLHNLNEIGYKEMTPIQAEALPYILDGKDVIAQAKTGSGKTAAFGIGVLTKLQVKKFRVQSLVLCPTRELADQVAKELRMLARATHNVKILTLCGGAAFGPQLGSLRHGAHIIVGTPGRILKHLKKETLSLEDLDMLVLDEADRMLDMGFIDDVEMIIDECPVDRQTMLFSATVSKDIQYLSSKYMNNPPKVFAKAYVDSDKLKQVYVDVPKKMKFSLLVHLLKSEKSGLVMVFCNTRSNVDFVQKNLRKLL